MTLDLNAKRIYVMLKHNTAIFAFFCIFWAGEKSCKKIFEKVLDNSVHPWYDVTVGRTMSSTEREYKMKRTLLATYKRESTLWKNANAFYHMQNWTTMECAMYNFSEELDSIRELGMRFYRDGVDVTEEEIKKRYGKPFVITFINERETNEKSYWFETKAEANEFFKGIMADKILGNFRKVK